MKRILSLFVFSLLFVPMLKAQKLEEQTRYKPRIGVVTICGMATATAGLCMGIGGFSAYITGTGGDVNSGNIALLRVAEVGGGLTLAGIGLIIAGAIHDHQHADRPRKWSAIAPKRNEIGVAYAF